MKAVALAVAPGEMARWRSTFTIAEFDKDQLAFAHKRALERDGLWLPPDGDTNRRPPRAVRRCLRRLRLVTPTVEAMARYGVRPLDVRSYEDNVLCTAGVTRMLNLLSNVGATQAYDATHTRILVGDGGGSAPTGSAADTDLTAAVAAANRYGQLVTAANVISGNQMTATSTFATGNGNFHWFEWCVDDQTEILTAEGWRRYHQIGDGTTVLGLDPETMTSRWEPLIGVAIWPERPRVMRLIESGGHSSLTTLDHRWLVRQRVGRAGTAQWQWRTTKTLTSGSAVPRAAMCDDLHAIPKYDDALVELVAWFWCEGWTTSRGNSVRACIGQSEERNPLKVAAIRSALRQQFPSGWADNPAESGMRQFTLQVEPSRVLLALTGPGKAPTAAFLRSLTRAQLLLLIDTALDGDGVRSNAGQRTFLQVDEHGIDAFEMACALAGIATNTRDGSESESRHGRVPRRVSLLKREIVRPTNPLLFGSKVAVDMLVDHEGIVWCPQTPSTTWLARRRGSIYWTGNCIDQATASGATAATAPLLNHKGIDMGTKSSSVAWTAAMSISIS